MVKELHLWMKINPSLKHNILEITIPGTETALQERDIVYTTIPYYLNFDYAERLFVHVDDEVHEIKIGKTEGTDKEIRKAHNLEKMLMAGAFDWYQREGV